MTVKELRKLLQGAKPNAEIVVHVNQAKAYRIASVDHFNYFDEKGQPTQFINVRLKVERKKKLKGEPSSCYSKKSL